MSSFVKITNGRFRNKTINGVFKLVSAIEQIDDDTVQLKCINFDYQDPIAVNVNIDDIESVNSGFKWGYTEEEVLRLIEERFGAFQDISAAMLDPDSEIDSLVVTGAPGIGKTYNLEKMLNTAEATIGQSFNIIGGKATPSGLYAALFQNRFPGQVLVLDDCDSVFEDTNTINMLKKALDSSKERWVSNLTMSKDLKEMGVPNKFQFQGRVVFLSNINFMDEIKRGTKISPHLNALISRAVFVDLLIHDPRSILLHVENVVRKSTMFQDLGLTVDHRDQALSFLQDNVDELVKLSIRTPLEIGKLMRLNPNWERVAKVTQLKPKQIIFAD